MPSARERVDAIYRPAMSCSDCFASDSSPQLHYPTIDLPQPRWIGKGYDQARLKILFVLLNPGQGDEGQLQGNKQALKILNDYKSGGATLDNVLSFQEGHMRSWGREHGHFLGFYTANLGLKLDEVSFINIALCATSENHYPNKMLRHCFEKHTSRLAREIGPDVLILSGNKAHAFESDFKKLVPGALVVPMLHYAHRKGAEATRQEAARVRKLLASATG